MILSDILTDVLGLHYNLKRFVVLENLLNGTSDVVVLLADNVLVKNTRGGVKRVDGGVDACKTNAAS
jgi:hypothetical protein